MLLLHFLRNVVVNLLDGLDELDLCRCALSMHMLYLTSIDGLVVLGLFRCTSELNFLLFTLRLLSQSGLLSLTVLTSVNRQKRCS